MKDGVNPLWPSHIECTGPCDRGERHYDGFALADPQLLSPWSDSRGAVCTGAVQGLSLAVQRG